MIIFTDVYKTVVINNNLKEYAKENAIAIRHHGMQPIMYHENQLIWLEIDFTDESLNPTYVVKMWDKFDNEVYCKEFIKYNKALNDFMKCVYKHENNLTELYDNEDNFKKRYDQLKLLIDFTKVGFYWETYDSYPVIEVFLSDSEKNINKKMFSVKTIFDAFNIELKDASVDKEMYSDNYGRIMIAFDRNLSNEKIITMVETLNIFGDNKMKSDYLFSS